MRPRSAIIALTVILLLGLSATATASARAGSLPGPSFLATGLVDFPAFQQGSLSSQDAWLVRARGLDAGWVRLTVYWSSVAPFNLEAGFQASNPNAPGYRWSDLDQAVKAATAEGLHVVLLVLAAPTWAEGPGMPGSASPGSWDPSPSALGAFAHAIAVRYSGRFTDPSQPLLKLPKVTYFQAWDEPNLPVYLEPQWVQETNGAIEPESPDLYRALLNSFYAAVKAVQPHAFVLAAGTAPYGDPPGGVQMSPLTFLREMFCLTAGLQAKPCADPPHFDALDHHPYAVDPTAKAVSPNDVGVPDLGKIFRVLHAAQRVRHALPVGPKSLWITEFDWASDPPSHQAFSLAIQAQFTALALYDFWRQGVSHAFWFQIRDPLVPNNIFTGGGLFFANGVAKPAVAAFRFPFVALPVTSSKNLVTIWGRAPVAGTVVISKRVGRTWRRLFKLTTTSGGVFYAQRRLGAGPTLRARVGAFTSPPWDAASSS
jgi:hypothetical protein